MSEGLSPRRIDPPVECALPYGVGWDDLTPCLPGVDERSADQSRAFRSYERQGGGAERGGPKACILTLRYPTADGSSEITVFMKETPDAYRAEAEKYRHLESYGVPTPRLLTSVVRGEVEVLVLEFLPRVGIDVRSADEVRELLRLLARLNAIDAAPGLFRPLPGRPREVMDANRRVALSALASDPRTSVDVDRWFEAFERSREAVILQPVGVNHGEFALQQCGWSGRDGSHLLVLFDLASLARRPRFDDIGGVLPALADGLGRPELEVFEHYLGFLREFGGPAVDADEATRELRMSRVYGDFSALYWLTHDVYEPASDELLAVARRMRSDLVDLGLLPPS